MTYGYHGPLFSQQCPGELVAVTAVRPPDIVLVAYVLCKLCGWRGVDDDWPADETSTAKE